MCDGAENVEESPNLDTSARLLAECPGGSVLVATSSVLQRAQLRDTWNHIAE